MEPNLPSGRRAVPPVAAEVLFSFPGGPTTARNPSGKRRGAPSRANRRIDAESGPTARSCGLWTISPAQELDTLDVRNGLALQSWCTCS